MPPLGGGLWWCAIYPLLSGGRGWESSLFIVKFPFVKDKVG